MWPTWLYYSAKHIVFFFVVVGPTEFLKGLRKPAKKMMQFLRKNCTPWTGNTMEWIFEIRGIDKKGDFNWNVHHVKSLILTKKGDLTQIISLAFKRFFNRYVRRLAIVCQCYESQCNRFFFVFVYVNNNFNGWRRLKIINVEVIT